MSWEKEKRYSRTMSRIKKNQIEFIRWKFCIARKREYSAKRKKEEEIHTYVDDSVYQLKERRRKKNPNTHLNKSEEYRIKCARLWLYMAARWISRSMSSLWWCVWEQSALYYLLYNCTPRDLYWFFFSVATAAADEKKKPPHKHHKTIRLGNQI